MENETEQPPVTPEGEGEPQQQGTAAPPAEAAVDDSPEAGIAELKRQLAAEQEKRKFAEDARQAERLAREEAERRASQHHSEAMTTRRNAAEAQYDAIVNALAAAEGELGGLQAQFESALTEGDFKAAGKLNTEIAKVTTRIREFENGKLALEVQRQQPPREQMPSDPKEAYIRSKTPRTAAWLRANDRFFTDSNFQKLIVGAHNIAEARGILPDTDEYFQFIEEQAGLRQAAQTAPQRADAAATTQRAAATTAASETRPRVSPQIAAPAAGSTATAARPGASTAVSLSPEEREFCRINDIPEANYAKQKQQLRTEGLIGGGD